MDVRIAQAGSSSGAGSGAAPRIVKVVKPSANETVTLELGYNQGAKIDLSGVANEKLKFVHVGEKLIILFDNGASVTVHPFFDSMGQPLQNLSVEVAPGQNLPSAQFASTFPINEGSATTQVVKVVKPGDEQAVTIELGYDQKVKLDLTAVADEKLTFVHIGEKLIILFDNQSTVTVHPFFDSMGVPLSNLSVTFSSGQDLPSGEFVSTVPISTDTTLLPTAGPGTAATEKSGAFFTEVPVEPLSLPNPLPLLPPEQLPVISFNPPERFLPAGEPADDASVPVAQSQVLHVEKDASVPGGTADVAGETISYTLAVTNQGNAAIADVVVDDPFTTNEAPVMNGGFNAGDTDQDNLLDVGETWQYTASHTVTQAELDAGTSIVNTATVTGTGATPDSDDASVPVAQSKVLHIEKDATVADGTANSTSDVINYTLAVTNQGNAAIAGVVVDDPFTTNEAPVLIGGFNVGDTDQDNLLDVGETWQYTASHTVTQAELEAGTNIVNTATVTGTGATPDSDDATVPVAQGKILHIEKDATVRGRHGGRGRRDDQLHAGGDEPGQRGDCQRGGGRSVHDRRGAGSDRRLQQRRHRPRTICWMSARPGSTRPATR